MKMMERKAYTAFGETGRHPVVGASSATHTTNTVNTVSAMRSASVATIMQWSDNGNGFDLLFVACNYTRSNKKIHSHYTIRQNALTVFLLIEVPASIRDPTCVRGPASIRTTRFTDEHVFKTPRFLVLYLLLKSEIPGRPTSLAVHSPLDLPRSPGLYWNK